MVGLIRRAVGALVARVAERRSILPEAVAGEAFYYLQRHPDWGRNATKAHKNKSYEYHRGICQTCQLPVPRDEATFHHPKRGVRDQHGPRNLVPAHEKCHNTQHGVTRASLLKASPRKRRS